MPQPQERVTSPLHSPREEDDHEEEEEEDGCEHARGFYKITHEHTTPPFEPDES